ncbi:MAG TPA: D-tyrosyl-tRNA(Tyr) deacylase [Candidatus Acetothermia bacterium]|nr:D-tyrosyl-tRNA(Tyr) deacylase [Candidatus Acetothermia bacterium]
MRIVLQRVSRGEVRVDGQAVAAIGRGVVLLVGFTHDDSEDLFARAVDKIVDLRIFEDEGGKMNRSLRDISGEVIAVPQFTLYGSTKKGRRPSFAHAALPQHAARLFDLFVDALSKTGVPVQSGVFGAHMEVDLINDGPVTFVLDLAPPVRSG